MAVWIRKELVPLECKRNQVLLQPQLLTLKLLVQGWICFQLSQVIPKFVIADYASMPILFSILDAIRIIVVLWRRWNHHPFWFQLDQSLHAVWYLLRFSLFQTKVLQLLLLPNLGIVKQIIRQKTNYLVAILLPVINRNLNASTREFRVLTMSHCNILCVKHNQRFNPSA